MVRFLRVLHLLALAGMLVACGKEGATSGRSNADKYPFRFGDATDPNGSVIHEAEVIPPGTKAAMSLYIPEAPTGTQVRTVWKDLITNADAAEQIKQTGARGFVSFQQLLPEGTYRVDIFYKLPGAGQWQSGGSHGFRVGKKS